jgi:epoxide hydrolase-like predicted phosphatase
MTIRAIFIDLGGVIVRTEFQAPRQHLSERAGVNIEDLYKFVFKSESSRQASTGQISEKEHWTGIVRRLHLPESEMHAIREEFFAGDIIDLQLLNALRDYKKKYKIGLISNAWDGLRTWIIQNKFDDAFDAMVISAEVGIMKPDVRIFQIALEKLGVKATEAIFLDDFPENVAAANALGMHSIQFTETNKALNALKRLLANHQ